MYKPVLYPSAHYHPHNVLPNLSWLLLPLLVLALTISETSAATLQFGFTFSSPDTLSNSAPDEARAFAGIQAAFQEINQNGGIAGQNVSLVAFSETTAPSSAPNGLTAIIARLCPINPAYRIPGLLYFCRKTIQPKSLATSSLDPLMINVFGSFVDEVTALVDFITRVKNLTDVSVIYVNDTIGTMQLKVVKETLEAINLSIFSSAAFVNVSNLLQSLKALANTTLSPPQAIIVLASGTIPSKIFNVSQTVFSLSIPYFLTSYSDPEASVLPNMSFNGTAFATFSNPLAKISSVLSVNFKTALQTVNSSMAPDWAASEGYTLGALIAQILAHGSNLASSASSSTLMQALQRSTVFGWPDSQMQFGPFTSTCTQGLRQVWLGRYQAMGKGFSLLPDYQFQAPASSCGSTYSQLQKIIVLGQTVALTGSGAQMGINMRTGVMAALTEQNAKGGIFGRKLALLTLDDGYEPAPALRNTQELIRRNVFAMIAAYGTATSAAAAPVSAAAGIPFIGHLSGSDAFRIPYEKYYVNIRAGYADEINCMVDYLTRRKFITRFSIMYQDDAYGLAGYNALRIALHSIGLKITSYGKYPRNTVAVEQGLLDIRTRAYPKSPEAIIVFGVELPTVKFIQFAKEIFPPSMVYMVPSPAGTENFRKLLGVDNTDNVLITQVVPLPTNPSVPLVQSYLNALQGYRPDMAPDWSSLEAYIGARMVFSALERTGQDSIDNRAKLVEMIYSSNVFPVDSLILGPYSSSCNQGMRQVWLSYIQGTAFKVFDDFTFNFSPSCFSDPTVLRPPLILGISADLSGPLKTMGQSFARGFVDSVARYNQQGGFNGQMLEVNVLDDYSDSDQAANATQSLIFDNDAFMVFSASAESAAVASLSEALAANVPLLTPTSGAMVLRKPFTRSVINLRASVNDELVALAAFMNARQLTKISYLFDPGWTVCPQLTIVNDSIATAMRLPLYTYGTTVADVYSSTRSILPPQAVIVCGSATWAVASVKQAISAGASGASFALLSVMSATDMSNAIQLQAMTLGNNRVFMSQVVPPISQTLFGDMMPNSSFATLDPFYALEGLMAVETVFDILSVFRSKQYTNQDYLDAVYLLRKFSLDQSNVTIGPYSDVTCTPPDSQECKCNQGMRQVWITQYTNANPNFPFEYVNFDSANDAFAFQSCGVQIKPLDPPRPPGETTVINLIPIILPAIGGFLAIAGVVAWRMSVNYRRMRLLHSNEAIATRCAEAISKLQFDEISFLKDIKNPNRIQIAFMHIITILTGVKKYVPDAVLQRLANPDQADEEEDEEDPDAPRIEKDKSNLETYTDNECGSVSVPSPKNRGIPHSSSQGSMASNLIQKRPDGDGSKKNPALVRKLSQRTTSSRATTASGQSEKVRTSRDSKGSKTSKFSFGGKHSLHSGPVLAPRRGMMRRRVSALYIFYDFDQMSFSEIEDQKELTKDPPKDPKDVKKDPQERQERARQNSLNLRNVQYLAKSYSALISLLVPIIKRHGGTIDKIGSTGITAVWGAYVIRSEGAQTACDVAMEIKKLVSEDPVMSSFKIHMAVTYGMCNVGEIITEALASSMVVGDSVRKLPLLADPARQEPLGVKILTDAKLRDTCQFTHSFRSATILNIGCKRTTLFALIGRIDKGAMDEWMYELNEQEAPAGDDKGVHYENAFSMFLQGRDMKGALAEVEKFLAAQPSDTLALELRATIMDGMENLAPPTFGSPYLAPVSVSTNKLGIPSIFKSTTMKVEELDEL